jgi:hypothetical protein
MVKYITYKGEKLPIRLAYSTLKRIRELVKKINDSSQDETAYLEVALFQGLKSGYVAENKEFNFKQEDMEFILDESLDEFVPILNSELFPPKGEKPVEENEDSKKK